MAKSREELEYTKYEIARILGARALQISANAPILLKLSKDELEALNYDPVKIAELEFNAGILPITIKRPFPKSVEEDGDENDEINELVDEDDSKQKKKEKAEIKKEDKELMKDDSEEETEEEDIANEFEKEEEIEEEVED